MLPFHSYMREGRGCAVEVEKAGYDDTKLALTERKKKKETRSEHFQQAFQVLSSRTMTHAAPCALGTCLGRAWLAGRCYFHYFV